MACRISAEYCRRGLDVVFLENDHLRVEVLAGKGADVTEIRDKRTDMNVLFEAPHEWCPPTSGSAGSPDASFAFLDHYPGGWQDVLPAAGGPAEIHGAPLALHGEAPIVPWDATITADTADRVAATFSVSLSRYPFDVVRELSLEAGSPKLHIDETITNQGEVPVCYSWLQHITLGEPLISPDARLEVPCETVIVDPNQPPNAQLPADVTFDWPTCDIGSETVDLREFPSKGARIHDLAALTDLQAGRYTVTNPAIDLGVSVRFPEELFEYLWYWRALGGFGDAPFFGRNYNVGLEPCTSIPNAGIEAAVKNETANELGPGDTVTATFEVETHDPNAE